MTFALDLTTLTVELTEILTTSVKFTVTQVPSNPNLLGVLIKYREVGVGAWLSQSISVPINVGDEILIGGLTEETEYEAYSLASDNTGDLSDADDLFSFTTKSSVSPPLEPVSSRILDNIVTTLQTIAPGSQYFGQFDLVTREQISEFEEVNRPLALVYAPETQEEEFANNQIQRVDLQVIIEVHYWAYGEEIDREADRWLHDVKKALMVDDTRGGLAINTTISGSARFHTTTTEARGLLLVMVDINYRHRRTDPGIVCG